ncbi:hypothetical protein BS47DRAFT_1357083 [Hydnum rufescens UP504]|uniref:Uncharacterized protein n=1 Tax=Hydnum rufescens UP504 TaxID=1448309 RepID=A0A9P6BD20_9AGAM|nr:hypothetical protein BS47DRAFT_1357083 [Hydnum rufescens UP504]
MKGDRKMMMNWEKVFRVVLLVKWIAKRPRNTYRSIWVSNEKDKNYFFPSSLFGNNVSVEFLFIDEKPLGVGKTGIEAGGSAVFLEDSSSIERTINGLFCLFCGELHGTREKFYGKEAGKRKHAASLKQKTREEDNELEEMTEKRRVLECGTITKSGNLGRQDPLLGSGNIVLM